MASGIEHNPMLKDDGTIRLSRMNTGVDERYTDEALAQSELDTSARERTRALRHLGLTEHELQFVQDQRIKANVQETMRSELVGVRNTTPVKLESVLDDTLGPISRYGVETQALDIINSKDQHLMLSLKQWQVVQDLVEQGILAGRASRG